MIQKKSIWFGLLILFFMIYFYSMTAASEITAEPMLKVSGGYDDNINFSENDKIDDFGVSVRPALNLGYGTELLKLQVFADIDYLFYINENDFNRLNQRYLFDGQYYLSERWSLLGDFEFKSLETIDSQLGETGRIFDKEGLDRYDGAGGIQYQITELTNIAPELRYVKTVYSDSGSVDNEVIIFSTPYEIKFRNQRDTLTLEPNVGYFDSDTQEAYNAQLTANWERLISEKTTFSFRLGPRYTRSEDKNDNNKDNQFGGVGELILNHTGETFSGSVDLDHNLYPDADGELVNRSRLRLNVRQNFSERFGFQFRGLGIYSSKYQGDREKVLYSELIPSLFYLTSPNSNIELSYNYQNRIEFDEPGEPTTHRNIISLTYNINFPINW
jgi:hypothetical protein